MTLLIEQRCVAEGGVCGGSCNIVDHMYICIHTHTHTHDVYTRDREISFKGFDYRNTTMPRAPCENIILKYPLSLRSLFCCCKKRYEHLRKKEGEES